MIAIIPARGGSKGLLKKNMKIFNGRPLIQTTIEAAKDSKLVDFVYVSTDDKEISDFSKSCGAESPFLRPKELSKDRSLINDTLKYMIKKLENEYSKKSDSFVLLQPTSPLRTSQDIDNAITLFEKKNADSVISYVKSDHPISWHKSLEEDGRIEFTDSSTFSNRQEHRSTFYPNGAIYVLTKKMIMSNKFYSKKTFAYLMPRERSVDIDDLFQFEIAEFLAKNR
tara:strand:- start:183 stop:857 length:675 start_codon:yes stop_codon:yes gene_type:complete